MKIIITGAAGYIGSCLAQRLKEHDLILLDNFSTSYPIQVRNIDRFAIQKFDVSNQWEEWSLLFDTDVIIHLAAVSGIKACDNVHSYLPNIIGTSLLGIYASRCKVKKIIFASSLSVYGESHDEITEETPINPRGLGRYALQKYMGELTLQSIGIPAVILRKSNVYGNGFFTKKTVVDSFIDKAYNAEDLTIEGSGNQFRNFVHIKDAVEAYAQAIEWEPGIYNIGGPDNLSISQLADMVIEEAKTTGVLLKKITTGTGGGAELKNIKFNYDKAKSAGFNPQRTVREEIQKRLIGNSNLA